MSMPFYVSPEQLMKDRADFARKGIARGRSVAVVRYADGVLFIAENPSATLHKISEIYDRIAFAGVGKYNEFEMLRVAGVRQADLKGYSFARGALKKLYREDLDAEGCVTAVVQALYDAADDDSATGGPDLTRRIFPVVGVITADGYRRVSESDVAAVADRVIAARMTRPDGPTASLT